MERENSEIKKQKSELRPMHRRPLLFRLTNRVTAFLILLSASLVMFFITGNQQRFIDSDLMLILLLCTGTGIALSLFSFFSLIESLYYLVTQKSRGKLIFILHAVIFIMVFVYAVALSLAARTITFLAAGI